MARRGKRTLVCVALGLLGLSAGALLVVRPFAGHLLLVFALVVGLVVGAVAEIIQATRATPARFLLGVSYLLGAGLLVVWPVVPIIVIGVVVGLLLLATGALEVWSALLARASRLPKLLVGVAAGGFSVALFSGLITLALGVTSMLWTDPMVLAMAIALGLRLVLVGSGLLVDIWYPPTGFGASTERWRLLWRGISLMVALSLLLIGSSPGNGRLTRPSAFYDFELAGDAPAGTLLRAANDPSPIKENATAIRMLYSTKDADGRAVPASAMLFVPTTTKAAALPLVVWAHGEIGVAVGCAPSALTKAEGVPALAEMLTAGYAVLAPDYLGLGVAGAPSFLIGLDAGHALLDAVRATTQVPGLRVGPAVLWGYSQGGHAALWAGQLAASYAPEVKLAGVAVEAPLANPAAVLSGLVERGAPGPLGAYLLTAYSAKYPDVRLADFLHLGERVFAEEQAARCLGVDPAVSAVLAGLNGSWAGTKQSDALATRLSQNAAAGGIEVPLLIMTGSDDPVAPVGLQDAEVAWRCRSGQLVDYRVYPGAGHGGPIAAGPSQRGELMNWLADRFAGRAAAASCR